MVGMQLNIQDRASVEAWKQQAQTLNEKAAQVVKEAANILAEFKDSAEGQIFDQVVVYSSSVIDGVSKILEGMNQILTVVNELVKAAAAKIQELTQGVKNVQSRVIG